MQKFCIGVYSIGSRWGFVLAVTQIRVGPKASSFALQWNIGFRIQPVWAGTGGYLHMDTQ